MNVQAKMRKELIVMGDCVKFPGSSTTFTMMSSVTNFTAQANEATENLRERLDNASSALDLLDTVAQKVLEKVQGNDLDNYVFVMDMSETIGDISEIWNGAPACVTYIGAEAGDNEKQKPVYLLIIQAEASRDPETLEIDDENITAKTVHKLIRIEPDEGRDRCSMYDFNKNKWDSGGDVQKLYDYACSDGAESDFLLHLANDMGVHPLFTPESFGVRMVENNSQLIIMYNSLHGLADFEFDCPDEDEDPICMLVPADTNRRGSCVRFVDGNYELCQYITPDDLANAMNDTEGEDGSECIMYDRKTGEILDTFVKPIFITPRQSKMRRALWLMWDRCSRGQLYLTLPLSEFTYIQANRPFKHLPIHTRFGLILNEKLTPEEAANYNDLRNFFKRVKKKVC